MTNPNFPDIDLSGRDDSIEHHLINSFHIPPDYRNHPLLERYTLSTWKYDDFHRRTFRGFTVLYGQIYYVIPAFENSKGDLTFSKKPYVLMSFRKHLEHKFGFVLYNPSYTPAY
jgi:hypothetical protein